MLVLILIKRNFRNRNEQIFVAKFFRNCLVNCDSRQEINNGKMKNGNVVPELYTYMRGFRKFCDRKFLQFRNVFLLQIFKIRKIAMIMITFTPIFSGKVAEGAKQL